jgi:hypothetical protein
MAVSLSAIDADRLSFTPRNILGIHFSERPTQIQGHSAVRRIRSTSYRVQVSVKSKAIPVTDRGLWGCEMLRIPHCIDNRLIDFFVNSFISNQNYSDSIS